MTSLVVITEAEAARALSLSLSTLRRLRKAGQGPRCVRLSARRLGYRRDDLAAWLEARNAAAPMMLPKGGAR